MRERVYNCGLEAALDVIGGKWKVLILWPLHNAARRFGELRREVPGISEKMLIQSLKEMELDGIVTRRTSRRSRRVSNTPSPSSACRSAPHSARSASGGSCT
jgi:DNA-binding HxlR family transcriptional regulator